MIPKLNEENGKEVESEFLTSLDGNGGGLQNDPTDGVDFFTSSTNNTEFIIHTKNAGLLKGFANSMNKTNDLFDNSHDSKIEHDQTNGLDRNDMLVDLDNSGISDFLDDCAAKNGEKNLNLLEESDTNVLLNNGMFFFIKKFN
jgi:hypothetical protein